MSNSLKKYLPLFLLFWFLFPIAEKGIHSYVHRNDFHCNAKADKHVHEVEHHCSACDFNISVSDAPIVYQNDFIVYENSLILFPFSERLIVFRPNHAVFLRGPPVLS